MRSFVPLLSFALVLACGYGYDVPVEGKTDSETFDWYNVQVGQIPAQNQQWLAEGLDAKARARRAWAIYDQAQVDAERMARNRIGATQRRMRNRAKYGTSFEDMVERQRKRGLEGDAIYEAIIEQVAAPLSKRNSLTTQPQ